MCLIPTELSALEKFMTQPVVGRFITRFILNTDRSQWFDNKPIYLYPVSVSNKTCSMLAISDLAFVNRK